jgi:hypothetical protein
LVGITSQKKTLGKIDVDEKIKKEMDLRNMLGRCGVD